VFQIAHFQRKFALRANDASGAIEAAHGVELDTQWLFCTQTGMMGGPAPRRNLASRPRLVVETSIITNYR
jgi:hypothetical protein